MADPTTMLNGAAAGSTAGPEPEVTSRAPCHLLQLPWEIRDRILRHLLHDAGPLRYLEEGIDDENGTEAPDVPDEYYRSFSFAPQILQTNKQLYRKGKEVLDSNTIGVDLCRNPNYGWRWSVAGHSQRRMKKTADREKLIVGSKVANLFDESRKIAVFIDRLWYPKDDALLFPGNKTSGRAVHLLCERLWNKNNLKGCRIDVTITRVPWAQLNIYEYSGGNILDCFGLLRCKDASITLESTTFAHPEDDIGQEYEEKMVSSAPVKNIYRMRDRFARFFTEQECCCRRNKRECCSQYGVCACTDLADMEEYAEGCDVDSFLDVVREIWAAVRDCRERQFTEIVLDTP